MIAFVAQNATTMFCIIINTCKWIFIKERSTLLHRFHFYIGGFLVVALIPMSDLQDNMSDLRFVMLNGSILVLLLMIAVCLSANIIDQ